MERSADGIQWAELTQVDAVGNSEVPTDYTISDPAPFPGRSHYRIRQTSMDGSTSDSEIREVNLNPEPEILVYPNPAQNELHVEWKNFQGNAAMGMTVLVRNTLGQTVAVPHSSGSNGLILHTTELPAGFYILEVGTTQGVFIERFTVE